MQSAQALPGEERQKVNLDQFVTVFGKASATVVLLAVLWALFKGYFVLGREYTGLGARIAILEAQNAAQQREMERLERENQALRDEMRGVKAELAMVREERDGLRDRLVALEPQRPRVQT